MSEYMWLDWHLTYGTDGKGSGFVSVGEEFTIVRYRGDVWDLLDKEGNKLHRHSDILLLMEAANGHVNSNCKLSH